ncbi:hypothetical protein AKJ16_DCAP13925 [Drosera capensis]
MGCTSALSHLVILPISSPNLPNYCKLRQSHHHQPQPQFFTSFSGSPSGIHPSRCSLRWFSSRCRVISRIVVVSAQSNIFRVVQTVVRVGKDGIEAGTKLVPDSVPRPIARVLASFAAVSILLFALKSFLSTVFFALGVMGFVYFVYLALNKDKGSRVDTGPSSTDSTEPTSTDEVLEEARRIIEKYK